MCLAASSVPVNKVKELSVLSLMGNLEGMQGVHSRASSALLFYRLLHDYPDRKPQE
jgi:hypothetical protein